MRDDDPTTSELIELATGLNAQNLAGQLAAFGLTVARADTLKWLTQELALVRDTLHRRSQALDRLATARANCPHCSTPPTEETP